MANTIVIASKLSLRLRLYEFVEQHEATPSGSRLVKVARQKGEDVVLDGPKHWRGEDAVHHARQHLEGGYAMTNIDADFWQQWLVQNSDSDLLRNKIIVAHQKDSAGMARESAKVRTGFEPLDMSDPAKRDTRIGSLPLMNGAISPPSTAEEGNQPA